MNFIITLYATQLKLLCCCGKEKVICRKYSNNILKCNIMNNYLLAIGWWNFAGSFMMIGFFHESFGKKMLNEWTKIFSTEFKLDYWSRFWLMWSIGLNIFFGLINIYAAKWGYVDVQKFLICSDILAYLLFVGLAIWGIKSKRTGADIYSVFVIFGVWIVWGLAVLI